MFGGRGVHKPPHCVVGEHPAVELLPHQIGGLAAQDPTALMRVGLEFIKPVSFRIDVACASAHEATVRPAH